jgi:CHAD domain-containing protein
MAKAKPVAGLDARAPSGANARRIVSARLEELYAWARYADEPYRVQELHDMRIATKRLRYSLEVFEAFLPAAARASVDELTQLQDELGLLHDSDVLIELLQRLEGGAASAKPAPPGEKEGAELVPADLLADLLDPAAAPVAEERYGLQRMLLREQLRRVERYSAFHQHWRLLQTRDFRREVLDILNA